MILAVSVFNFNQKRLKNTSKKYSPLNPLPQDAFDLQNKSVPSFSGLIPIRKIFRYCNQTLRMVKEAKTIEESREIAMEFFVGKMPKVLRLDKEGQEKHIGKLISAFRHEIGNAENYNDARFLVIETSFIPRYFPDSDILTIQKELMRTALQGIKDTATTWAELQQWSKPDTIVSSKKVLQLLKKIPQKAKYKDFSIEGAELLLNKDIKNPIQFYTYVSQVFLNAVKYGEGKPVKVKFEKVLEESGKECYYISVTNHTTIPISEEEIGKILEGRYYRGESAIAAGIKGSGKGFKNIIEALKTNEYPKEGIIKSQDGLFTVRLPLFGVVDKKTA